MTRWPAHPVAGLVDAASVAAVGLALHAAVNARLLRRLPPAGTARRADRPATRPADATAAELVSVLIPARDEASRIAACLRAVLASEATPFEVVVLDDGSTDDTAAVVRRVSSGDPRLRLLTGRRLPPGWLGKPHACAQLAEAARGEILAFLDADVVVAPDALARSAALLHAARFDLVSPYPRQLAVTAAERLVQPLLQWSWLTFLPLRAAERSPRPSLTAANGQLLVCRALAYRTAGGHAGVRGAVIEDVELARAFKRAGLRVGLADGAAVATCRMYSGWRELRDGYSKSLWAAAGSPAGTACTAALLVALYVAPPLAVVNRLVRHGPGGVVVPVAGYLGGVAGRAVAAARTGGRVGDVAAHPVSVALLGWLTARSLRRRRAGSLTWKGRAVAR